MTTPTTYDARRLRLRGLAAAALLLLLAPLSACQLPGQDDGSDAVDETAAERADAMLEYAQCMRENGVPMEDPEPGGRGGVLVNGKDVDPDAVRAAEEECGHLMEGMLPEDGEMGVPAEQQEAMLAQAQCMRERGWDVPDPQFDGGRVQMRLEGGIDPEDPAFQADQEECAEESGLELPRLEGGE